MGRGPGVDVDVLAGVEEVRGRRVVVLPGFHEFHA